MNPEEADGAESLRERVVQAMAELWARHGYEETSLEQIADRVQVGPEALTGLFAGREEVATAVVDKVLADVVATVTANYSADRAERDSYLMAIHGLLEMMAARPSLSYVTYIGSRVGPPAVSKAHAVGIQVLLVLLERLSGDSNAIVHPPSAARGALGGPEAVVRRNLVDGQPEDLPLLLPDFVYSATVPFLGQEEALRLARRGRGLLSGSR